VGVPVFIPFMGALIALKEAPRDAWMEAWVGIGGPILGTAGAALCEGLFLLTHEPLFRALAYTGFFLNLFNLAPITPLDGGRVATALSPWLWVIGLAIVGVLAFTHPNLILFLIIAMSLPRVLTLFRKRTDEEKRYFELAPGQRFTMAMLYFGLLAFLVLGMHYTHIAPPPSRF
jgi:Zn-dependent protease